MVTRMWTTMMPMWQELNAERKEVVLRDITLGADGLYRLIGPYVELGSGGTLANDNPSCGGGSQCFPVWSRE